MNFKGIQNFFYLLDFYRHEELEVTVRKEESVRKLKKNLKLVMIALIVLGIEKFFDFILALASSSSFEDLKNKTLSCTC